ncbi:hypothetical protein NUU61_007214 [Penicillium alfredii]|uniref:Uncharacterized protein n=1 Tax=Penicillium alfredii TaxID=1506179 RepID=A0A9W9F2F8_9EURO|nr:uncharacterized protein NUU61_007214 [Penicillium alfredii]KAJ5092344.1 hypothetical protein NUU61_007214 [Penicillium alfredii]
MDWVAALTYGPAFVHSALAQLLSSLFSLLRFTATPLVYLGHCILYVALIPLRIVAKFEAFLSFVTGAVLTGALVGLCLHFTGSAVSQLLRIKDTRPRVQVNSADSTGDPPFDYLESKVEDRNLVSDTIVEEEETSQDSG